MIEQLAVLVYGVLTIAIAGFFAGMMNSPLGMALAFAAAGTTYVFQFANLFDEAGYGNVWLSRLLVALLLLTVILTIASAVVSFAGY